jgi:voltage-gated potassium channel
MAGDGAASARFDAPASRAPSTPAAAKRAWVETSSNNLGRRVLTAGLFMLIAYSAGTVGYFLLGGGRWSLGDCAYMTVISLTTVGYGEILENLARVPYARLFTSVLLIAGAGAAVYFVSVLTTFLVEGEFLQIRRRSKMRKKIEKLSNHIIVCGIGGTGRHVISELVATHWPFVAIDPDGEKLARLMESYDNKLAIIEGDATDDNVLIEAGILRAFGVVASLPDDKGNLYIVVTARGLNPNLRIVAKAMDALAVGKLRVAGADSVVSVNNIGGLRMASEMIRPNVVTFLDKMMRDKDKQLRFEELTVPPGSPLVGKRLADSKLRAERNLLIVAARDPSTGAYTYSPGPDFVLLSEMTLILIGETEAVQRLRSSPLFSDGGGEGGEGEPPKDPL